MEPPICELCGEVITEEQADVGDYVSTTYGEWHDHCIQDYERDRDGCAADFYHDARYDT